MARHTKWSRNRQLPGCNQNIGPLRSLRKLTQLLGLCLLQEDRVGSPLRLQLGRYTHALVAFVEHVILPIYRAWLEDGDEFFPCTFSQFDDHWVSGAPFLSKGFKGTPVLLSDWEP